MNEDAFLKEDSMTDDEPNDLDQADADELFQKNFEAFKDFQPLLANKIRDHKPISKLTYLENGEPSVEFGGEQIYPRGAMTEAADQIKNYHVNAKKLQLGEIAEGSLDPHASKTFERLKERYGESGFKFAASTVREESYFLIVFGVGLAQHLDALMERTNCRVLYLIEPNIDLMHHSWHVYDWQPLLERMKERGGIEIEIGTVVENVVSNLHIVFRQYNPTGLDGTTVFKHYKTSMTDEVERNFADKLATALMGLGFFQDEMNMLGQSYKNLESGKTRMVQRRKASPQMPCMIVGNGPSLDKLLPVIKENEDNVVIFASGSAITTLIENDIIPDYWIMSERVKEVLTMVEELAEEFDTKKLTFVGSTTVFPGVTDYFDDYILYLRPGLSSMPAFKTRNDQVLTIPDPLAANSSLSVAVHLGFREFYFMGVDAGSRFTDRGHAKGGFYSKREDFLTSLPLSGPANFGGTIYTTSVLTWSRENLEKLMRSLTGRTFYNMSDGALIENAMPMHHKAAKFTPPPRPKAEIVAELTHSCPIYTKEEFDEQWDEAAIIDRLPEFCDQVRSIVLDGDLSDFQYLKDITELLEPMKTETPIAMMLRGTIFSLLIASEFLNNRFLDADEYEASKKIFKEEFDTLLTTLNDRAVEVFLGLEDGEPWEGFVE